MQQSQSWGHAELCWRLANVLAAAIERAGVSFYAAPEGMTVRVRKDEAYEPDALVAPLPKPDRKDLEIPAPVLVVEVLSPSTTRRDLADKLAGYFQVPSVQHYLVIDGDEQEIIWHRRAASGAVEPPRNRAGGLAAARSARHRNRCRRHLCCRRVGRNRRQPYCAVSYNRSAQYGFAYCALLLTRVLRR